MGLDCMDVLDAISRKVLMVGIVCTAVRPLWTTRRKNRH
jgi:hypothetical protein